MLSKRQVFVAGLIIGAAAFLFLYGTKPLHVTQDGWLVAEGGDISQHYLGWVFFRKTPWAFPLGLVSGITYPDQFAVTYMDSIPLLAILFKLLSPLLPSTFQYFGLYGLATYMLQAGLGAAIVYSLTRKDKVSILASFFFVFSTILMARMFSHTALACNPIILAALYLFLNKRNDALASRGDERKEPGDTRGELKEWLCWTGLLMLSSVIHLYYIPMVGVILFANYFWEVFSRRWFRGLAKVVTPCALTLLVMFLVGDFYGNVSFEAGGLGDYSSNLNALFNDQGSSFIGMLLNRTSTGNGEAFAYLGAGVILLLFLSLVILAERHVLGSCQSVGQHDDIRSASPLRQDASSLRQRARKIAPMLFIVVAFLLLSLEPVVAFGEFPLITISFPSKIASILAIFRTNARFLWPIFYLVMVGSLVCVIKRYEKCHYVILLALVIQLLDLTQIGRITSTWRGASFEQEQGNVLRSSAWDELTGKREIYFFYNPVGNLPMMKATYRLGDYAADHDMVMNDFYVSRKDDRRIEADRAKTYGALLAGEVDDDKIYVFPSTPTNLILNAPALHVYLVDGLYLGVSDDLSAAEQLGPDSVRFSLSDFQLINGAVDDEGMIVGKNGVFYGPYMNLQAGTYRVRFEGDNLNDGRFDVHYGEREVELFDLEVADTEASYTFTLKDDVENLEFRCINNHPSSVLIASVELEKVTLGESEET